MTLRLPNSVSSVQDIADLERELRDYGKWFAHNEIKMRVGAKTATPPPALSPAGLELIRDNSSKKLLSNHDIDAILHELGTLKQKAESVTITLAAPAGKDVRQVLVGWCRDAISPTILVNFQFNASLLGGIVVRYRSRVFDWSFRRQILENRNAFAEELRRV